MKVPVLSFGASSLGSVFHETCEAESIKAVFTAIENGMNFIDVSLLWALQGGDSIRKSVERYSARPFPAVD